LLLLWPNASYALSAKDMYFEAERCYKEIRNSSQKQQARDHWIPCIKKFQSVYQYDPNGSWAAAGLYMSGKLFWELYQQYAYETDKKEALDIFERIILRYPKSSYRQKASHALRSIQHYKPSTGDRHRAAKTDSSDPRDKYVLAEKCYNKLRTNTVRRKYRDNWLACIRKFEAVYHHDPQGPWAAAGLYMTGVLYEDLFKHSFNPKDQQRASEMYQKVISDYPKSRYKPKADAALTKLCKSDPKYCKGPFDLKKDTSASSSEDEISEIIRSASKTKSRDSGQNDLVSGKKATVTGIRYWSNPSYTRVVIDADDASEYTHHLLKKDPSINKPPRLYVDVTRSRLGGDIKKAIPIDDNLLSAVRAGQYTKDKVRVVIDIKSFKSYKIFPLRGPFRIVIDVWGDDPDEEKRASAKPISDASKKIPQGALAKQLALGVSRVVIDPGHGGKDPGAPGYLKNVYEKNVTLGIARQLAEKIRKELKCEVVLTRTTDRYLTLEERTAFANTKNADLFISVHANAHRNRNAYGIETFYLNLATDDEAIRVAARANATSTKNISDLQSILSDLMQNAKINESSRLAAYVQDAMQRNMKKQYSYIKDNGVKQAPFYVLLGAQMPSILIETSFISNPRECKRLVNSTYQSRLCDAIVKGIKDYINETSPKKISYSRFKNGTTG